MITEVSKLDRGYVSRSKLRFAWSRPSMKNYANSVTPPVLYI